MVRVTPIFYFFSHEDVYVQSMEFLPYASQSNQGLEKGKCSLSVICIVDGVPALYPSASIFGGRGLGTLFETAGRGIGVGLTIGSALDSGSGLRRHLAAARILR